MIFKLFLPVIFSVYEPHPGIAGSGFHGAFVLFFCVGVAVALQIPLLSVAAHD
jgi:hypothetical protein